MIPNLANITKSIILNTQDVKLILEGNKTVIRRPLKIQPPEKWDNVEPIFSEPNNLISYCFSNKNFPLDYGYLKEKRKYQPGDIIYVKEGFKEKYGMKWTWSNGCQQPYCGVYAVQYRDLTENAWIDEEGGLEFKYFENIDVQWNEYDKWRSPIHMPKEAARIFLKIKSVNIERLQDITYEQAEMEGFKGRECDVQGDRCLSCACMYCHDGYLETPRAMFKEYWDKNRPKNKNKFKCPENEWRTNPWVWVYEFELTS